MASTNKWLKFMKNHSFLPLTSGEEVDQNENSAAFAIKITSVDVLNKIVSTIKFHPGEVFNSHRSVSVFRSVFVILVGIFSSRCGFRYRFF